MVYRRSLFRINNLISELKKSALNTRRGRSRSEDEEVIEIALRSGENNVH